MNKLIFTENDISETSKLADLIRKIDVIDTQYISSVSDEIFEQQPFFLSVLLGYKKDVSMEQLEEIMKIYFLVWEYFISNNNFIKRKVTSVQFEKIQMRNIHMLRYSEGELEDSKGKIYTDELGNLRSKALWMAVLYRCHNRQILINMNPENRAIILIGILSFIQCFEANKA